MHANVTEIAPDTFRISTFHPDFGIQFNQFLVRDDEPLLVHTGLAKMFSVTRDAVASLIDPASLRWIGFSHFEPDECGALNEWLAVAPRAQAVCNFVGNVVMLGDFASRPARVLADGEVLPLGRRSIRHLSTPHVPHGWDACLLFEESERTLFCSDLFFQPGDPEPLCEAGIAARAGEAIRQGQLGPLANDVPYTRHTDSILQRLADLEPRTLAIMHGSSYRGDGGAALRDLAVTLRAVLG